ncbi:hypothetical protein TSTA_003950 [Talaromyces stipitatus ATCC 10500]|uniref:DUF2406 domain protein n=1 Tax=Talaromyces stipitatus (strain ATCC 10500 / CBS 375.48 / QM 6759 / NRRL 1006) TaxID=441959 RepID=B8MSL4_TALSN|nr:uncharacterized protein TSTA_003950 [Talaromyces stipitatus ATCC 10500]XP_002487997.1 uncharacterized protein TSTA_003950 [Talaromyces stipitatus ATCC 10500]EED12342.1 hypothetical protein TSTA_003950 [Talaromyces stipitatus ATCC 10500]EED12343.1 hypothetical protein TSTA_003950 [Talaromyces stipitatus ATCC 10500]
MATRYANNNNNQPPLPSPPTSPRRSRGISFGGKSEKSHRSSHSAGGKISLHETPEEKAKRILHTKADPTLAMNEAQPATVALLEKSNLGSLRSIQHKDQYGNIITDPDLSNPTRPRLERPLDTIRSFEAAIDGSYHNRRMSYATDASQSRPGSYYGEPNQNGYGRPSMSRPDSYVDYGASGSNGYYYNQGPRGNRPRHPNNRVNSDYTNGNGHQQQQNFYPNSPYQRSQDNFTAGSGSANTDQWGNSTDPSSVNSSFDRLQQQAAQQKQYQQQQQPSETYGLNGFGGNPQIDTSFQHDYRNGVPAPPPHGQSNGQASQPFNPALPAPARKVADTDDKKKRGSWFKRRFSKD